MSSPLITIGGGSGSGPGGAMTRQGHKHNNDSVTEFFSQAIWKCYCRTSWNGSMPMTLGKRPFSKSGKRKAGNQTVGL